MAFSLFISFLSTIFASLPLSLLTISFSILAFLPFLSFSVLSIFTILATPTVLTTIFATIFASPSIFAFLSLSFRASPPILSTIFATIFSLFAALLSFSGILTNFGILRQFGRFFFASPFWVGIFFNKTLLGVLYKALNGQVSPPKKKHEHHPGINQSR